MILSLLTKSKIKSGELVKIDKNMFAKSYKRKSKKTFPIGVAVSDSKYGRVEILSNNINIIYEK